MSETSTETHRIEQDLEHTRARLDATIGALQQKLSPGQLLDQTLEYLRGSGGAEFTQNLRSTVQNNPLPVSLMGIGLAWLMVSGKSPPSSGRTQEPDTPGSPDNGRAWVHGDLSASEYAPDLGDRLDQAADSVLRMESETEDAYHERRDAARAGVLGMTRRVGESASEFRARIEDVMRSALDRSRDAAQRLREATGRVSEGMKSAGNATVSGARTALRTMRDTGGRTIGLVQEQPLVLGAMGIALGAFLGSLLPRSRIEGELGGPLGQTLRDGAQHMAAAAVRSGAQVAGDVLHEAGEAAQRAGLTSGAAAEGRSPRGVEEVAAGVQSVVQETAAAGRRAIKDKLGNGGAGDHAGDSQSGRENREQPGHISASVT